MVIRTGAQYWILDPDFKTPIQVTVLGRGQPRHTREVLPPGVIALRANYDMFTKRPVPNQFVSDNMLLIASKYPFQWSRRNSKVLLVLVDSIVRYLQFMPVFDDLSWLRIDLWNLEKMWILQVWGGSFKRRHIDFID